MVLFISLLRQNWGGEGEKKNPPNNFLQKDSHITKLLISGDNLASNFNKDANYWGGQGVHTIIFVKDQIILSNFVKHSQNRVKEHGLLYFEPYLNTGFVRINIVWNKCCNHLEQILKTCSSFQPVGQLLSVLQLLLHKTRGTKTEIYKPW